MQAQNSLPADDFANKSIEELMNVDVTSVSRKDQKLSRTPAAVYVITQEAIQASGATTIPDLLRMAPGVQVAQVEPDRWAISVRGFNSIYSNKLLVLVDGRTVYTPSFSGVYWDQINIPLDTIERIEVIRGPGGTVWGANAVNGVINIITSNARDSQGTRITAGAGSAQTAGYQVRYGGQIADSGAYRIFGSYSNFESFPTAQGINLKNGWGLENGGFRVDQKISSRDSVVAEGNVFNSNGGLNLQGSALSPVATAQLSNRGFNVMGRWTRTYSETSQTSLQFYQSDYSRHDTGFLENMHTSDFDFQNQFRAGSRNDVVWGGGYRYSSDNISSAFGEAGTILGVSNAQLLPQAKGYSLFSTFVQDEIPLSDRLALTAGSKFEHNAFSGFEYEPSARLAWTLSDSSTAWAAVSRAVRQPSRLETALNVQYPPMPVGNGIAVGQQIVGNPDFQPETVVDYEAGYRVMPNNRVSFDLAAFYSLYSKLQSYGLLAPVLSPSQDLTVFTLPVQYVNGQKAHDYGAEGAVTWNVIPRWRLAGSYSWLRSNLFFPAGASNGEAGIYGNSPFAGMLTQVADQLVSSLTAGSPQSGTAPRQQFGLQSYLKVNPKISFDNSLYYVGRLAAFGVPSYMRLDSRLGYKLRPGIQTSIVGQNLLSPQHLEFGNVAQAVSSQIPRSVFGSVTWSF